MTSPEDNNIQSPSFAKYASRLSAVQFSPIGIASFRDLGEYFDLPELGRFPVRIHCGRNDSAKDVSVSPNSA
jgi:hypothetical protein